MADAFKRLKQYFWSDATGVRPPPPPDASDDDDDDDGGDRRSEDSYDDDDYYSDAGVLGGGGADDRTEFSGQDVVGDYWPPTSTLQRLCADARHRNALFMLARALAQTPPTMQPRGVLSVRFIPIRSQDGTQRVSMTVVLPATSTISLTRALVSISELTFPFELSRLTSLTCIAYQGKPALMAIYLCSDSEPVRAADSASVFADMAVIVQNLQKNLAAKQNGKRKRAN